MTDVRNLTIIKSSTEVYVKSNFLRNIGNYPSRNSTAAKNFNYTVSMKSPVDRGWKYAAPRAAVLTGCDGPEPRDLATVTQECPIHRLLERK